MGNNDASRAAEGMRQLATAARERLQACAAVRDKALAMMDAANELTARLSAMVEEIAGVATELEMQAKFMAFQIQAWDGLASEYQAMAGGNGS